MIPIPIEDAHEVLVAALLPLIATVREAVDRVLASATRTSADGVDEEAVHDFRVALRRLRTFLRPARRLYGRSRMRRFEAELRHHAEASGALRDEEVLRATLMALALKPTWRLSIDRWLAQR